MNPKVNLKSNHEARQSRSQHGLILLAVASLFLALSLSACRDGRYLGLGSRFGSGRIVAEARTVGDFDRIEVRGEGTVYLTQGEAVAVSVETDDNLVGRVNTRVKGHTLLLSYDSGPFGLHLRPTNSYVFHITVVDLSAIKVTGSADVWAAQVAVENIALDLVGSGQITFDELSANEVSAEITGKGKITLAGAAATQHVTITGSGIFDGRYFEGHYVDVDSIGSGLTTVWALEALDGSLEGDGTIQYYGDVVPQIASSKGEVLALGNR